MRRALVLSLTWFIIALGMSVTDARAQGPHGNVRWDLVQIAQGAIIAGGSTVSQDASGDTITLTGSGDAWPVSGVAYGGGTFVHRHADNSEVAHGIYQVTALSDWQYAGGFLPIPDFIANVGHASAGRLVMRVRLWPSTGGSFEGILVVECALPNATLALTEGVRLIIEPFNFVQKAGGTLFHVR